MVSENDSATDHSPLVARADSSPNRGFHAPRHVNQVMQFNSNLYPFRVSTRVILDDAKTREAVEVAQEAEKKILEVVPNIMHVSVQLQLGRSMPEFPQ